MALGNFKDVPTEGEKQELKSLVFTSTMDTEDRALAYRAIDHCSTYKMYTTLLHRLQELQPSIDQRGYQPGQKEITTHLKKIIK